MLMLLLVSASAALCQVDTTVYDLNNGLIQVDTLVLIQDVIVTAVAAYGFYVQEQASGAYSGIFIYTGSANPPTVEIGNVCDIIGPYVEYNGFAEINMPNDAGSSITVTDPNGTPPEPIQVQAWQTRTSNPVEAEKWESVLVRVVNLEVLDIDLGYGAYCAVEFGYALNDTLRLDDQFDHSQPPAGTLMAQMIGVIRYSYGEFNTNPREDSDLIYLDVPTSKITWSDIKALF
ncbi:MAG: hypothetical protein GY835_24400 [bacterium]|nr:hypothetical protein [bacterium]